MSDSDFPSPNNLNRETFLFCFFNSGFINNFDLHSSVCWIVWHSTFLERTDEIKVSLISGLHILLLS